MTLRDVIEYRHKHVPFNVDDSCHADPGLRPLAFADDVTHHLAESSGVMTSGSAVGQETHFCRGL